MLGAFDALFDLSAAACCQNADIIHTKNIPMNNEKLAQIASTMLPRQIGIELELLIPTPTFNEVVTALQAVVEFKEERYNHITKTWWKLVPDHSLHASSAWQVCEIVSPPLLPNELFKQTKLIC